PVRSRSLFLWDDGQPMRFFLRPGQAKLRLAPLLLAGGGRLCRVQEPGAVLLAEPGQAAPGGAVSTQYVTECVERNQRLPLGPFTLPTPPPPPPLTATPRGRLAFTAAEDAVLVRAVRERGAARAGGRALWRELERAGLTRHSWQAMRSRFLRHLRPRAGPGDTGDTDTDSPGAAAERDEEAAPLAGLFAAANREFEDTKSESDSLDTSEEQDRARNSPAGTASGLNSGLEGSALCDTQVQQEGRPTNNCSSSAVGEVVKIIQHLMEKFGVDLVTVTQAFLKNSGEVEAASYFLETGQRLDGYPIWSREDDLELQKDDEHVRNKLIAKFGAENVAKRIGFRKS
ncbi:TE2IP protein, partial [Xiphorhynchus elegans]|nr:TE2IP protein [Xiphorhynchus elegans]